MSEEEKKEIIRQEITQFIQHLSKKHTCENEQPSPLSKKKGAQQFWLINKSDLRNLTDQKIQIKIDLSDLMPKSTSKSISPTVRTPRTPTSYNKYRFKQNTKGLQHQYLDRSGILSKSLLEGTQQSTERKTTEPEKKHKNITSKNNYTPIYKRYQEEVDKKEDKLKLIRRQKQEMEELSLQSLSFQPNLSRKKDENRTFNEFYRDQEHWSYLKQGNIQYLKDQIDLQNQQSCTYSPQILSKSLKILDQQNYLAQFKKPEDRLLNYYQNKGNRLEAHRKHQILNIKNNTPNKRNVSPQIIKQNKF